MASAVSQGHSLCPTGDSTRRAVVRFVSCTLGRRTVTECMTGPATSEGANLPSQSLLARSRRGGGTCEFYRSATVDHGGDHAMCTLCGHERTGNHSRWGARFVAMRCLHCGDVIDHVILMNRWRSRYARLMDDREHQRMNVTAYVDRPARIDSGQATLDGLAMLESTPKRARPNRGRSVSM